MAHALVSIAIVGTGVIGPRHAASVAKAREAELHCFVDPAPHAQAIADNFGVELFSSIQHMLDSGRRPDAALICTPNKTHVALSVELLQHGIHVLVEKPISTTIDDGRRLLQVAQISQCQLLVGHHRRFNPYITATKRVLDEGAIGKAIAVSGTWALRKPDSYFQPPTEWRTAAQSGGGPVLINLVHEIDILSYLFGPITRVHAEQTMSQRGFEVEEGAAILLRFASGLVGTFILSDCTPSPHNFEGGTGENPIIPQSGLDFYRIFGSEGTLSVGDMKAVKHARGEASDWSSRFEHSQIEVGTEVPFDEQIEHFVRVVRGEEQPRCSGSDGLSALVICDAVKRALQKGGGVVDIDTAVLEV